MPEGQQQDEFEVVEHYTGPPAVFGLQWSEGKTFMTRRGERHLTKAAVTPTMEAAWDLVSVELGEAGFSWEGPYRVLFWERIGWDAAALAEVIDSLPDRAAKAEAEALRREEERREREAREAAERRERDRDYIEAARGGARSSLRD